MTLQQMIRIIFTSLSLAGLLNCSNKESETENSPNDGRDTTSGVSSASGKREATSSVGITNDHIDRNFDLIDDFEKSRSTFHADTIDLNDYSSDDGRLVIYYTSDRNYIVLDFWLFGETGKIHATYWTDSEFNFIIVKRTDFVYDRPYYVKDFKTTETTEFYSYPDSSFRRYDLDKKEIKAMDNKEMEMKVRAFFSDRTRDIKIVK